jgi:hypothetical protein
MRISLPLLALVLYACAGVARGVGYDPATHAIRLTDLGAGFIPTAINNVNPAVGQAAGALYFADRGDSSFSPSIGKA